MTILSATNQSVNRFPDGNFSQNSKISRKEFFERRIHQAESESSEFTPELINVQGLQKTKRQNAAAIKKAGAALFAAFGLDCDNRDFLFTLYGLSNGQKIFYCSYAEMYKHLFKSDGSELDKNRELKDSARQKVRRRIEHLESQQSEIGIAFAEIHRGSKDGKIKHPTQIILHLTEYVDEVLQISQKNLYGNRSKAAIGQAAREVASTLCATMTSKPISSKPKSSNPHKKIKDGWKRAAGTIKATLEQMEAQGYEDWAIMQEAIEAFPPKIVSLIQNGTLNKTEPGDTVSRKVETQGGGRN